MRIHIVQCQVKNLFLMLGLLTFLSCSAEKPDLSNPLDPESPVFTPGPPTDFHVTPVSDRNVELDWRDESSYEEGYIVERAQGTRPFDTLALLPPNTEYFIDSSGIKTDSYYLYRVGALVKSRASKLLTAQVMLTFPVPSGLHLQSVADSSATMVWRDYCTFETGFAVARSTNQQAFTQRALLPANTTSWTDGPLSIDTAYAYVVRAFTDLNSSLFSTRLQVRALADSAAVAFSRLYGMDTIRSVYLSPSGSSVVVSLTSPISRRIEVVDVQSGSLLRAFSIVAGTGLLAVSPDTAGMTAVYGTIDGKVEAVDLSTSSVLRSLNVDTLTCVGLTRDGAYIAIGRPSGVSVVKVTDGTTLGISARRNPNYLAFCPDGIRFLIGYADGTLEVRRTAGNTILWRSQFTPGSTFTMNGSGNVVAINKSHQLVRVDNGQTILEVEWGTDPAVPGDNFRYVIGRSTFGYPLIYDARYKISSLIMSNFHLSTAISSDRNDLLFAAGSSAPSRVCLWRIGYRWGSY